MGWGGANGDRKRSERAARLLRESGSTWLSARRDSRDRYVCSGLAVAGEGIFNMGLARAIPAQRNTRGHWIIHPATSGGDASIPPAFRKVQEGHSVAKMPLLEILTRHPRTFLVSVGLKISEIAFVSIATVFSIDR